MLVPRVGAFVDLPECGVRKVRNALGRVSWLERPHTYILGYGFFVGSTQEGPKSYVAHLSTEEQEFCIDTINDLIASLC